MKLEIGKFIRTKPSGLILEITEDMLNGIKSYIGKEKYQVYDNIIDLIENKDLCEIEFYSLRYNERVTRLFEVEKITDKYINFKNARCEFMLINKQWNSEDLELKPIIKKVLTHEQFENNCFRIGDE